MDINGAKALKERLGLTGAGKVAPAEAVDVPDDAPPVYHWTGKRPPDATSSEPADEGAPRRGSLFSRVSFGLR